MAQTKAVMTADGRRPINEFLSLFLDTKPSERSSVFLSVREAADLAAVNPRTIHRWVSLVKSELSAWAAGCGSCVPALSSYLFPSPGKVDFAVVSGQAEGALATFAAAATIATFAVENPVGHIETQRRKALV